MSNIFFVLFQAAFFIIFFSAFAVMAVVVFKSVKEWGKNNRSPRLSVRAKVADKRSYVRHANNGRVTSYYATFEFEGGDRTELRVPRDEFGLLVAGDEGTLSFQGTRYLGFGREV